MRKIYLAPGMTVVRLQHHSIICTSTGGYDGRSISIQSGGIDDEGSVWTKESSDIWDEDW